LIGIIRTEYMFDIKAVEC